MFARNFIITKHISAYLITQSILILTKLHHLDYNNPHVLTAYGTFLLRQIPPLPPLLLGCRLRILKLGGKAQRSANYLIKISDETWMNPCTVLNHLSYALEEESVCITLNNHRAARAENSKFGILGLDK